MSAINNHIREAAQRQLATGVLEQAAQDLRRFRRTNSLIERELCRDAYSWFISDDCSSPFSFLNVCQLLNLSPEDVRQELVGDRSFGRCSQWARSCCREVRCLSDSLNQRFAIENFLKCSA